MYARPLNCFAVWYLLPCSRPRMSPIKKTLRQQAYVKESLERAFDEMKQARREGRKLQSADDFIKELEAEEAV